ncbi:E3 ubiquitin-protein ligase UPL3-like isoform X4 [Nicotiana sylvestris]|uniref:E3 ubiquitin-protein ligase UPL3-like isoform X4 n=1 Tax=Nicotiana sylvestris TaxID=4096 RepID=UPI00388C4D3F
MAVLSYLDFFSTGVQRVALATAANMCKKLPSDAADFVMEAVPLLTNLLQYHDAKFSSFCSVCMAFFIKLFGGSSGGYDFLHQTCYAGHDLMFTSCFFQNASFLPFDSCA